MEFTYELQPHIQVEHPLDRYLKLVGIIHKMIPVGRKEYNGKVERTHRTDDEELYRPKQFADMKQRREAAREFLHYYNNFCPHSAFGYLTAVQKLLSLINT